MQNLYHQPYDVHTGLKRLAVWQNTVAFDPLSITMSQSPEPSTEGP